jgi:CheY-like chemotaxis protein
MALVLIVDDDDDIRFLLRLQVTAAGHEVVESKGGAEALATLLDPAERRPDCVVLDLRMPTVDGWAVLDQVRHQEDLAELAVLIVSAHADQRDRERSAGLGVKFVLNKPVEQQELVSAISSALQN